jgi:hypothetical protein
MPDRRLLAFTRDPSDTGLVWPGLVVDTSCTSSHLPTSHLLVRSRSVQLSCTLTHTLCLLAHTFAHTYTHLVLCIASLSTALGTAQVVYLTDPDAPLPLRV